jgi:hypothetical protein
MIQCTEEAYGIFAVPFYQPDSLTSIIKSVSGPDGWKNARVTQSIRKGQNGQDRGFNSSSLPGIRSAGVLDPTLVSEICKGFDEKMDKVIKPLIRQIWQVELKEHHGTHLIRYQTGGYYKAHRDVGAGYENRYFSVICYLNDEFEGGQTWFPYLNYSAIPERGKAILFPSSYIHCAQPVTRGEKYILISWVIGPPPIRWI